MQDTKVGITKTKERNNAKANSHTKRKRTKLINQSYIAQTFKPKLQCNNLRRYVTSFRRFKQFIQQMAAQCINKTILVG